jgi:hypothetical protein
MCNIRKISGVERGNEMKKKRDSTVQATKRMNVGRTGKNLKPLFQFLCAFTTTAHIHSSIKLTHCISTQQKFISFRPALFSVLPFGKEEKIIFPETRVRSQ